MGEDSITQVLSISLIVLICILFILCVVYLVIRLKERAKEQVKESKSNLNSIQLNEDKRKEKNAK